MVLSILEGLDDLVIMMMMNSFASFSVEIIDKSNNPEYELKAKLRLY